MPAPQVSPSELDAMLASDPRVRVIDVRTGGEFEAGHIPGAYHVPVDALGEHRRELAEIGDPVVLVCESGARACRAETSLLDAGKDTVQVLRGGMGAWRAEGREVVTLRPRWALERQVRLVAGGIVLASVLGSVAAPRAKWLAAAVGGGLTVAALTDTCAMGTVLSKLPYNRGSGCHAATHVARLRADAVPGVAA